MGFLKTKVDVRKDKGVRNLPAAHKSHVSQLTSDASRMRALLVVGRRGFPYERPPAV